MAELAADFRAGWAAARMAAEKFEDIERSLMTTDTEQLPVHEFLEREAGGRHHRAVFLADLESAVEGVHEEFKYDKPPPFPAGVWKAIKLLAEYEFRV